MTTAPTPTALPAPTQDERTVALLVNVLAIFSSFLAPLIFFVGMIIAMIFMFSTIAIHPHNAPDQARPLAFFGVFGLVWLWGMGGWVLNLVLGIVYAIKANHGEWARFPLIGDFVLRKILPEQPIS
jgi:uncharacterized Tic20 family protein